MLLATSALLLGIPAAATAYASSATTGTGWIRLAHLSPNTPAVDVYLYSFGNSNAMIVLHHVAYGTVSPYESVQAGDYSVAMRGAGAPATSQPVLSTSVTISAGHAYTVAGMGPESGLRLAVLDDDLTTPSGQALVRVIQASLKEQVVKVTLGSTVLAGGLKFASVSSYQNRVAGRHDSDRGFVGRDRELERHARRRHRPHPGRARRRQRSGGRQPGRRVRQRQAAAGRRLDGLRRHRAARTGLAGAVAGGHRSRFAARPDRRPEAAP